MTNLYTYKGRNEPHQKCLYEFLKYTDIFSTDELRLETKEYGLYPDIIIGENTNHPVISNYYPEKKFLDIKCIEGNYFNSPYNFVCQVHGQNKDSSEIDDWYLKIGLEKILLNFNFYDIKIYFPAIDYWNLIKCVRLEDESRDFDEGMWKPEKCKFDHRIKVISKKRQRGGSGTAFYIVFKNSIEIEKIGIENGMPVYRFLGKKEGKKSIVDKKQSIDDLW